MSPPRAPRRPRTFLPPSPRGNLIDLALAACSALGLNSLSRAFLGLIQRADRDPSALGTLSLVVGLVAGLRVLGLYLKRPARRVDADAENSTGCLPFLNFGLMALLLAGASVPLMNLISRREAAGQGSGAPFALLVSVSILAFLILEWGLFLRAISPARRLVLPHGQAPPGRERARQLVADVGLFTYIAFWQMLYHLWLSSIPPWHGQAELLARFGYLPLSLLIFCWLYLTPRLVYLLDDWRYRATWGSIGLVWLIGAARLFR